MFFIVALFLQTDSIPAATTLYDIPVIVELGCSSTVPHDIFPDSMSPRVYDISIFDMLQRTATIPFTLGHGFPSAVSIRGASAVYTIVTVNDRRFEDRLFGSWDNTLLPVPAIQTMSRFESSCK